VILIEARYVDARQGLWVAAQLTDLNVGDVPAIDRYEFGLAFKDANDYKDALDQFTQAAAGVDPEYRSAALQFEAQIYYALALDAIKPQRAFFVNAAKKRTSMAYHALDNEEDFPPLLVMGNEALAYLADVQYGARFDCPPLDLQIADEHAAWNHYHEAMRLINHNPDIKTIKSLANLRGIEVAAHASLTHAHCQP
jgi:hypothetical protein